MSAIRTTTNPPLGGRGFGVTIFVATCFLVASTASYFIDRTVQTNALVVLAVIGLLIAIASKRATRIRLAALPIGFIGWAALSFSWSANPGETAAAAANYAALTGLALIVAAIADLRQLRNALGFCGVIIAIWSLVWTRIRPYEALNQTSYQFGALQGVFSHRNILAFVLFSCLIAAIGAYVQTRKVGWLVASLLVGLTMLFARSSTSLAAVSMVAVAVLFFVLLRRIGPRARIALYAMVVPVGIAFTVGFSTLFEGIVALLGRDVTLSGRTFIWQALWPWIYQRPLNGWGWQAVWSSSDTIGNSVRSSVGFEEATHAHNGYLDALLQLGGVGLALLVVLLLALLLQASRTPTLQVSGRWPLLLTIGLIFYNIVETRFLFPFGWFLVVALYAATITANREALRLARIADTPTFTAGRATL